jgi:hypothetical protein
MTNLGYIVAAYGITLAALAGYGVLVCCRLRAVERELTALPRGQETRYGQR